MRYLPVALMLCVVAGTVLAMIQTLQLKEYPNTMSVSATKPTTVKAVYQNGTIVSNGAILVGYSGTMCPGVIVKLDSGQIVGIIFQLSTPDELKEYRIAYGERVRCEMINSYSTVAIRWRLVPKLKK